MRRGLLLLLLVVAPASLLALILAQEAAAPPGRDRALAQYQALVRRAEGIRLEVVESTRAAYPETFTPAFSARTISAGLRFVVDAGFDGPSYLPALPFGPAIIEPSSAGRGQIPLPYPPSDVWCVTLAATGAGERRLVFAARHEDLYTAAWVVHESDAAGRSAGLLGCAAGS
jgi:hypothetical protein